MCQQQQQQDRWKCPSQAKASWSCQHAAHYLGLVVLRLLLMVKGQQAPTVQYQTRRVVQKARSPKQWQSGGWGRILLQGVCCDLMCCDAIATSAMPGASTSERA